MARRYILSILILGLLAVNIQSANLDKTRITDYGVIEMPKCYENGAVEVKVTSMKEGNIFLPKFIKGVGAINPEGNETIDLKRYWYDKEGYWFYDDYSRMTWATKEGKAAIFISDEFLLNEKGTYTIRISGLPMDIVDFFTDAQVFEFNFTCPGYLHNCYSLNPKIEQCFSGKDFFYAYFTGLGEKTFSKINLTRDLKFLLNYETYSDTVGYEQEPPASRELYRLGNDRYALKIPIGDLEGPIDSIFITVNGCIKGFHNISDYSSCDEKGEEITVEEVKEIIKNETIENIVLNISQENKETPKTEEIPKPLTRVGKTFRFLYEMLPVKEGSLRSFLRELGR